MYVRNSMAWRSQNTLAKIQYHQQPAGHLSHCEPNFLSLQSCWTAQGIIKTKAFNNLGTKQRITIWHFHSRQWNDKGEHAPLNTHMNHCKKHVFKLDDFKDELEKMLIAQILDQ
jgi:hypothetical protein